MRAGANPSKRTAKGQLLYRQPSRPEGVSNSRRPRNDSGPPSANLPLPSDYSGWASRVMPAVLLFVPSKNSTSTVDPLRYFVRILPRPAIDVALLEPGLLRGGVGPDRNDQPPTHRQRLGHVGDRDAKEAQLDAAIGDQPGDERPRGVERYGEANAVSGGNLRRIDPHHPAIAVDKGTAAVSRIDGGVGLDQAPDRDSRRNVDGAVQGTDETASDRRPDGKVQGLADGDDRVADLEIGGASELDRYEALGVDPDNRQVHRGIAADELRLERAGIGEDHDDLGRSLDDVVVGADKALVRNHLTGAYSADGHRAIKSAELTPSVWIWTTEGVSSATISAMLFSGLASITSTGSGAGIGGAAVGVRAAVEAKVAGHASVEVARQEERSASRPSLDRRPGSAP